MSTGTASRALRFLRPLPLLISAAALVAAVLLADMLVRRELAQLGDRAEAEANHVAAQLRVGVLQAFDPLQRIGQWWLTQGRPLAPEDWQTDARLFVKRHSGVRMVTWVSAKGDRSWPIRPGENLSPKSFERPDAELGRLIEISRRLGSTAVSRVFSIQGAPMLYACVPVSRGGRLAGFAAGLYDASELAHSVLDGQLPDSYSVTLTADGYQIRPVAQTSRVAFRIAREATVPIANTVWSVRLTPSATEATTMAGVVIGFGALVSILLYACAAIAVVARARAAELAAANGRLAVENQERRRAEDTISELNRDLQRRLHEFDVLLEVLPIGISVAEDRECRSIWMNRSMAAMMQAPLEQNISKSAEGADQLTYRVEQNGTEVSPEELPMQLAARTGRPVLDCETEIVRGDGSVIQTLSYSAPVFDENGAVRGVINACVDITDRKRAEDEQRLSLIRRRELEQEVEKYESLAVMAGGLAHDFNNLLTVIMGNANLLGAENELPMAAAARVAELLAAADRAAELTSRLLAFTGQIWCKPQPVNLADAISSVKDTLRDLVPRNIELRYDVAPDLPAITADVSRIQQALRNLVENAMEALNGAGGVIDICVGACDLSVEDLKSMYPGQHLESGRYIRVEVADNGCGVPKKIASRVFDPFFTTKFVGRGLGLSAAQGIVRAHHGGIRLTSVEQRGTQVEMVLPL